MDINVKAACKDLRTHIGVLTAAVDDLARDCKTVPLTVAQGGPDSDRGEMIANAILAKRHLEDARMRIGKVIQAFDGGVRCYGQ